MYLHDDAALFEEVLLGTAAEFSMSEEFVAKDYWTMMMLAEAMKRSEILVFKGGTCLSKCYGVISRFSEDVDLGIPYEHATEGMRKAIKRTVVDSADALGVAISNLPETRSSREYNRYGIALGGMARSLILETAVMTPASPYSIRPAQSFAGAFVESRDASPAKELGLLTFEVRANSLEHTFADKVFAICDYYMSGDIPARQSRHIYDLRKLLGMVSLDDGMRSLIETVRAQRVGGYGNPSADGGVDLSAVLEEIVEKGPYRSDYERVTMPLLYEDVSYDEAVIALSEIAAFLKANWILPNIIRLKSDQNVKTSRKNVAENPGEALWMRSWRALPPACGRVDCGCVSGRRAFRFNRNMSVKGSTS